ncbi:MAG TPA: hypothetical protein VFG68_09440 [Fimbriiglobus sp.]|nr:hypothetical protein [Fimbriiglobus sp.]
MPTLALPQSAADAMVANAFETRHRWAYQRLTRAEQAPRLLTVVELLTTG